MFRSGGNKTTHFEVCLENVQEFGNTWIKFSSFVFNLSHPILMGKFYLFKVTIINIGHLYACVCLTCGYYTTLYLRLFEITPHENQITRLCRNIKSLG